MKLILKRSKKKIAVLLHSLWNLKIQQYNHQVIWWRNLEDWEEKF